MLDVRGIVQGVGFRPYVYSLATALNLRGFVRNHGGHVTIDVEGESASLQTFLTRLPASAPAIARIDDIESAPAPPCNPDTFVIASSGLGVDGDVGVSPDVATCDACLAEVFDPNNRRYRYPFTNCSHCGPRYSIIQGVPYDRERTTMAGFVMCAECHREHDEPGDRRFHAQPIACPACGPSLKLYRRGQEDVSGEHALQLAISMLRDGWIVAVKGLGGFHLACDATNEDAVARLRQRKGREAKPLAVMVAEQLARTIEHPAIQQTLRSPERPIVLIDRRDLGSSGLSIAGNVASGCATVGLMLPYTPLHHLLMREIGALVMTSGNRSGEPIAFTDDDARHQLECIADALLSHDRPIHARCDDSVIRVTSGARTMARRARGLTPAPIRLAKAAVVPVLAVGGHLKNTFCLAVGREAYMSPHIGDLDEPASRDALRSGIAHYVHFLGALPDVVVHDRHPDYASTALADQLGAARTLCVQHHHAHVLSCMAEHQVEGAVIGVAFDGAGWGDDDGVWGGEFLLVEGTSCMRAAHLAYVPLPGGDNAARQPWRMALAHALNADAHEVVDILSSVRSRVGASIFEGVRAVVEGHRRGPMTSSMGRLFDAVASLTGVRHHAEFEGQPAMALEAAAAEKSGLSYEFALATSTTPWIVDPRPVVRDVVRDVVMRQPAARIARAFHDSVASMIADVALELSRLSGIRRVVLTGGVFQNGLLLADATRKLAQHQLEVLTHQQVPCNDGGLALGQALYGARMASEMSSEAAGKRESTCA